MKKLSKITGSFWYSFEEASKIALQTSKNTKTYWTAIKGMPDVDASPEECWAITNKYDPRVK